MIPTKTYKAVSLYRSGNIKAAIAIFKTFKIGLTESERRAIQIYHECLTGNSDFYKRIGEDVEKLAAKAKEIIEEKFLK